MEKVAPVLFLVFNRPETTKQVFEAIRLARPHLLFVAADGPRLNREREAEKCAEVKKIIGQVDWDCEVQNLFRQENLGCKRAIRSAIDWFFSHVEEGIILEDDCLPDPSFFSFATEMLDRYRFNHQIKIISGTNYLFGKFDDNEGYYFSRFMPIWGWAAWRRSWIEVDFSIKKPSGLFESNLNLSFTNRDFATWLDNMVKRTLEGNQDAWSPYLAHTFIANGGLGISPFRNLISNIGHLGLHTANIQSTHPFFGMKMRSINIDHLPSINQIEIVPDKKPDQMMMKMIVSQDARKNVFKRIGNKIKRMFT